MLASGEDPAEYVRGLEALAAEEKQAEPGMARALVRARLGDYHLRWDRPGDAVGAYEAGLAELDALRGLGGKTFLSARPIPLLGRPIAPPVERAAEVEREELIRRLRLGAAFGYLAQGQVSPAQALVALAEVRADGPDPLEELLSVARLAVALGQSSADALQEATEKLPEGAERVVLAALAQARSGSWEAWPALARALKASSSDPKLAAVVWSTWAAGLLEGAAALARQAAQATAGVSVYDEAIALSAQGELELAVGRPTAAVAALQRALERWGTLARPLPTDPARVAVAGMGLRARNALVDAELARGDRAAALEAAEDLRGAVLEAETLRPGDDPSWRPFVPRRLVYLVQPERTLIFAVQDPGQVKVHTCPMGAGALRDKIRELQLSLRLDTRARELLPGVRSSRGKRPAPTALRELYDALIEPVIETLQGGDPAVIEPDGPLWALPFAALRDREGEPLGARMPLVLGPSAGVVARLRARPPSALTGAVVVGDPDMPELFGRQLAPLPGARREALWLGQHLEGAEPWTGPVPTLPRVIEAMRRARVIHLGTHGLSDPERPERAFLALAPGDGSDGLLTLERLVTADPGDQPPFLQAAPGIPSGREWLDADLVTLSACQTALGQLSSDGVVGLARAFLSVGARTVVASLWNVDDEATAELMETFYGRWLAGEAPAVALQQASEAMRAQRDDPRLWAPFVVLGAGLDFEGDGTLTRPGRLAHVAP